MKNIGKEKINVIFNKLYKIVVILLIVIICLLTLRFISNQVLIGLYNNEKYSSILAKIPYFFNVTEPYIVYYNDGNVLYKKEQYSAAIEKYKKALEKNVSKERVCDVRVNLSLATIKNITTTDKNEKLRQLALAKSYLYKDNCMGTGQSDGSGNGNQDGSQNGNNGNQNGSQDGNGGNQDGSSGMTGSEAAKELGKEIDELMKDAQNSSSSSGNQNGSGNEDQSGNNQGSSGGGEGESENSSQYQQIKDQLSQGNMSSFEIGVSSSQYNSVGSQSKPYDPYSNTSTNW